MKYLSNFVKQLLMTAIALMILSSWLLQTGDSSGPSSLASVSAQTTAPACLSCRAGTGGIVFVNGTDVRVKILAADSAFTSNIFLRKGGPTGESVPVGSSTETNKVVTLNTAALLSPNNELTFGINVANTGNTFLMGGPTSDRVSDGVAHAKVECIDPSTVRISFEDQLGGGDLDFNDVVIEVSCVVSSSCAQCRPGLGGQLFAQSGRDISVRILPSSSALVSSITLRLKSLGPDIASIGTNKDVGTVKVVSGALLSSGEELIFAITLGGNTFMMGDAVRNPDVLRHATVECVSPGVTRVSFEDTFGGGDGDFNDAIIEITCMPKCDSLAFHPPQYFLSSLGQMPRGTVLIGGVNSNTPVNTGNPAVQIALQGGNPFSSSASGNSMQQLNRVFVAAQLSLGLAGGSGSPTASNALWANLGCPSLLGDFVPIPLSNGVVLTPDSMLKDLFKQTQSAIHQNRSTDFSILTNLLSELTCDDLFCTFCCHSPNDQVRVKCPPPRLPNLVVDSVVCTASGLRIKIRNTGTADAGPTTTCIEFLNDPGGILTIPQLSRVSIPTAAIPEGGMVEVLFSLPSRRPPPPCAADDPNCIVRQLFPRFTVNLNCGACILESTRVDNAKSVTCP